MTRLIYFFYSLLVALAMLVSSPYWLYQVLRHGKYRSGFLQRMGGVPARLLRDPGSQSQRVIWVHAVSVGEVLAVSGLVQEMRRRFDHRVLVTSTTDTGQALARKRFGEENVFYFPMDFSFSIRPYLRALRPELIVLAETEFWPNFLRLADASGARIAVVNGRISDRSWPRYRRFRWALGKMLAHVELFLAQTEQDSNRLRAIGAPAGRVQVTGNLKFDVSAPAPPAVLERLRQSLAAEKTGPVLVCGSSVEGEEPLLLKAFQNLKEQYPGVVMILAPRHPERFAEVGSLIAAAGLPLFRRSRWQGEALAGRVLLLDSVGELAALYALADLAFVGGSLVPRGGHNIIEPAQHGLAIVVGTHTENFRDIVSLFQGRDAVRIVGPDELSATFSRLLANEAERRALGKRALETVQAQTGATLRTVDALEKLLATSSAQPVSARAAHHH